MADTLRRGADSISDRVGDLWRDTVDDGLWTLRGRRSAACGEPFASVGDRGHGGGMTMQPIIRTQSDLHRAWLRLVQPLGFGRRSLWLLFIGPDHRPIGQITEVADLPTRPRAGDTAGLTRFLSQVGGADLRVGVLVSRPGAGLPDADDRAWADAVYGACRDAEMRCETVHVATATAITPVPRDDLRVSA